MRGLLTLRRGLRALRTPDEDRALILCYHRVARLDRDPSRLAVSPEHFEAHLDILARRNCAVSMTELTRRLATGEPLAHSVAVTFDDGYADNFDTALPALRQRAIPATFYIATDCIDRTREFWWDEIERACGGDSALFENWRDRLLPLDAAAQESALADLKPVQARASHRTMTLAQLQTLAAEPLIEIGAHTVDHLLLTAHPPAVQQSQIVRSKQWIEESLARPVSHFSYPYGEHSAATRKAVSDAGLTSAVTCASEYAAHDSSLLALPRYVVPDCSGEQFTAHLDRWFR